MSTFKLMTEKRFAPFFWVQFLGALNDNLFKNILVGLLAFRAAQGASEADAGFLINLAAGLFILPFFLFSAISGQLADKFEKGRIMRWVKASEIGIMAIGGLGFFTHNSPLLFFALFLMGVHSTFFGPVKYSILPQHLKEGELMSGNGLVEMGTFVAILLGTLWGGYLEAGSSPGAATFCVMAVAAGGWALSFLVPEAPPAAPNLVVKWNPLPETAALFRIIKKREGVYNSVFGISWYWYFGATLLAQLPVFTSHTLHAEKPVWTLFMAIFVVAIGFGSVASAWISRGEIELGIVPIGAAGMTIFMADLFFRTYPPATGPLLSLNDLLNGPYRNELIHIGIDLGLCGLFSSFFIVPLYAMIQSRSDKEEVSRVIAANNVMNSIFMVVSALVTMAFLKMGLNTVEILFVTALMNAIVSLYIFLLIPEFFMRFVTWLLASTIYRMRTSGRDNVPRQGAAVIVANHISWIDWFVLTAACRRPVRFVMDHNVFKNPAIGWIFKLAKAIPIAPAKEDAALKEKAFDRIACELKDGNLVCIFPEGAISRDGEMHDFRPGVERILQGDPVPVIPVSIGGLWGSFFSRSQGGKAMQGLPHPSRRVIEVNIGQALPPTTSAKELEAQVRSLLGVWASPAAAAKRATSAK